MPKQENFTKLARKAVVLALFHRGATESSSILDGAVCDSYVVTVFGRPCLNLIDANKLSLMTATLEVGAPDFTYRLNEVKEVQTVFISNA